MTTNILKKYIWCLKDATGKVVASKKKPQYSTREQIIKAYYDNKLDLRTAEQMLEDFNINNS